MGWRRTAIINVVLISTLNLVLLILLAVSISQPGASLSRPSIIFNGSCTTVSTLNLLLHLLINIVSTAVLASSNFFMQILNAPSRQEINLAHSWLHSLDIGIPSIRNLWHVSKLKSASWIIFLITSVPIHLLLNSSVFETTYEGSQWQLTMAAKAFTQGAPFFPPGASLTPAGGIGMTTHEYYILRSWDYGESVDLEQYWNSSSSIRQKLRSVAEESHSWAFLSASQCYSEYLCKPRRQYGDVVLVLDSTASGRGFSSVDDACYNTCFGAMGLNDWELDSGVPILAADEPWLISFFPAVRLHDKSLFDDGLTFNDEYDSLRVNHCLAQEIQPQCKVGVSNMLLLIVTLSFLLKAVQGGIIAKKLPSASLVTPGDAIESFILYPDAVTKGLGTLDITKAQQIEFGKRRHWSDAWHLGRSLTTNIQPRKWQISQRRLWQIIPYGTWFKTYSILFAGMILLSAGFAASSSLTSNEYYVAAALFANSPQLILSLGYFPYNSLLTQFNVEKDWNSFSLSHQPLRVSYPVGQQISSYRLQLPYKHSVPLIIISTGLHWVVSNSVFLYINEGGTQTEYITAIEAREDDEGLTEKRLNLARRKLRWGATSLIDRLPASTYGEGRAIFHLGFSGEEHSISEPKNGQYYL
ncbi:hypothetical protein F5B22DRAFT_634200 [Xylaria bambusicola]|uniref:uncharacterized protein n=1 Tax=Xylaria bambusicola TaxID=326684 RepID=UPI002008C33F|nr:uncharacterized protein F5B22DRAFT_634200 [Xylaria bambusicola]KAI0521743.1 hypothetical protein F5B22DRAFT_634200 [Xylaria bambusicola]